jgi:hypothetical protein
MRFETPVPGHIVRNDKWGMGDFGARRAGGSKFHDGVDLIVVPGQPVFSMIDGTVEKYEQPYATDSRWGGIQIANDQLRVEIWYISPHRDLVGKEVKAGEVVGMAQDISQRYNDPEKIQRLGNMTPHVHIRVTLKAFVTLADGRYVSFEQFIDPLLLLGD